MLGNLLCMFNEFFFNWYKFEYLDFDKVILCFWIKLIRELISCKIGKSMFISKGKYFF